MHFSLADIPSQTWKNGGGSTQELSAQVDEQGAMLWRVSLAEIAQDGAFSTFPELARIHCIVSGEGLTLSGADHLLEARPLQPLYFDGALELFAQLKDGPSRAFNLIYDPLYLSADMQICTAGTYDIVQGACVIFVLVGEVVLHRQGQAHLMKEGEGYQDHSPASVTVSNGGQMVLLTLDPL